MEKELYTLEDLMAMKPEERSEKIKKANITKGQFANKLMTDKKFKRIPGKGAIIKKLGTMSEESFQEFILSLLNQSK